MTTVLRFVELNVAIRGCVYVCSSGESAVLPRWRRRPHAVAARRCFFTVHIASKRSLPFHLQPPLPTRGLCYRVVRQSVRPCDVRPLTPIPRDAISLHLVEEFQWNLTQVIVMWVAIAEKRSQVQSTVPTHPWKYLIFFSRKLKALKVLENRTGAWKSLNFIVQVLESPWIHQSNCAIMSNFVKHMFCLKQEWLIIVTFCFYQLKLSCNHINKY